MQAILIVGLPMVGGVGRQWRVNDGQRLATVDRPLPEGAGTCIHMYLVSQFAFLGIRCGGSQKLW